MLPREKLLTQGVDALSTKELFMILLGSGTSQVPVSVLADKVASIDIRTVSVTQLMDVPGVGVAQACKLAAVCALASKLSVNNYETVLDSPKKVYQILQHLTAEKQEHFFALYVDARKQLVAKHLLFKGTADAMTVHPRDIFRHAVLENATGIIIAHNHPSGSCEPSDADILFTNQVAQVGELLNVPLLDHVIIGNGYWSFAQSN